MSTAYAIDLGAGDVIPVRDVLVDLDGALFRLRLTWRERQALWYLDLWTGEGVALLTGHAMQPGCPALTRRQGSPWPDGALLLSDISGASLPATMDGLGVTHELVYLDGDALTTWRAAQAASADLTIEAVP